MFRRIRVKQSFIDDEWYVTGARTFFLDKCFKKKGMLTDDIVKWFDENCSWPVFLVRNNELRKVKLSEMFDLFEEDYDPDISRYDFVFVSDNDATLFRLTW